MKIAVPVKRENQIDDHFGHCEFYNIYSISEKKEITDLQIIRSVEGCGCKSNIAGVLATRGVKIMLAGGIGGGAINLLNNHGIEVVRGCSGNATEIVKMYISGQVKDSGESCKQHSEHSHQGNECGHNDHA